MNCEAPLNLAESKSLLKASLAATFKQEFDLFQLGAGERAIVHQLALRVRKRAPTDLDVDIEYNREGINNETKLLPPPRRGIPDLIIHQRGYGGPQSNVLVCEVKRVWQGPYGSPADVRKIRAAIIRYGFRFGVILELGPTSESLEPRWSWWTWNFFSSLGDNGSRPVDGIHPQVAEKAQAVFKPEEIGMAIEQGRWQVESRDRPLWSNWQTGTRKPPCQRD